MSFIEPLWAEFFGRIETEIPDPIPHDWRSHPVVNCSCEFVSLEVLEVEMKYLIGRFPDFDRMIAPNPPTAIHHLYHLARWAEATGLDQRSWAPRRILEWGGGYGSVARLILDWFYPDAEYTIIDHPAMHRLSRHFLGKRNVRRLDTADAVEGTWDLFISTWALSESSAAAQDHVIKDRHLFGAEHLLLAYDPRAAFYGTDNFTSLIAGVPGRRERTSVEGSLYLFR